MCSKSFKKFFGLKYNIYLYRIEAVYSVKWRRKCIFYVCVVNVKQSLKKETYTNDFYVLFLRKTLRSHRYLQVQTLKIVNETVCQLRRYCVSVWHFTTFENVNHHILVINNLSRYLLLKFQKDIWPFSDRTKQLLKSLKWYFTNNIISFKFYGNDQIIGIFK